METKVKVLDLGCGDGINAAHFEHYFAGMEYFGIDVSHMSIMQAKKSERQNVHFECYDGKKIPYKDGSFDIILVACVLHHVPHGEHRGLLSECKRALKENGSIYIFEHNPANPATRKIVDGCEFDRDAVLVHKGDLKKIMDQIGFRNVRASYTIFFPRKGIFKKLVRFEGLLKGLPLGGQYYLSGQK